MRLKRGRVRFQPSFFDGTHQVDSPARAIIFIRSRDVSRTSFETESAMNAGENLFFFVSEGGREI